MSIDAFTVRLILVAVIALAFALVIVFDLRGE